MEWLKAHIGVAFLWVFAFFSPTYSFIVIIGFFCICDAFTGIMASNKEKQPISSWRLRQTIRKFLAYGITILVTHVMCFYLLSGDSTGLKFIGTLICLVEVKSIDENIKRITGFGFLGMLLEKIKPKGPHPPKT